MLAKVSDNFVVTCCWRDGFEEGADAVVNLR